jgi:tetratricopeptide (TPR) repeat protein
MALHWTRAICLLSLTPAAVAQRAGSPVAIVTQIVDEAGVEIVQSDLNTPRPAAPGELVFPGDRVRGAAIVVECRGSRSVRWLVSQTYVAGQSVEGRTDVATVAPCEMPEPAPAAGAVQGDELLAQQLELRLTKAGGGGASATDYDASQMNGLPPYDSQNAMSVLRFAQALDARHQLRAAIDAYTELAHRWSKAAWVPAKIERLKIALFTKLLQTPAKPGHGHVTPLVIGISEYYHGDPDFPQLHYAHIDAQSFADYLKHVDPQRKFDALLNGSASLANIREQLSRVRAQSLDGSTGVLFISAHGMQDNIGSYIASHDVHQRVGIDTAIPISELLSAFSGFEQAYVFVDACRTRVSTGPNNVNSSLSLYGHDDQAAVGMHQPRGQMFILMSTGPGSYSAEGKQFKDKDKDGPLAQDGHGAFTYYLLKSLYLGAGAQPRRMSRGELQESLREAMKPQQIPDWGGNLSVTAMLDPLQQIPFKPPLRTRTYLDFFRAPIRLAVYGQEQDQEPPTEMLDRLRAVLGPDSITPEIARQAMEAYRRLTPLGQMQVRSTIRTALEDIGQRLLLNYLDGYQTEPDRRDFQNAKIYYSLAEELAPDSLLLRARLAFNTGREMLFDLQNPANQPRKADIFRAAIGELFDAYRDDPGPYVLNALGIAYMENGDFDKAVPAFDDASRLAPQWLYPKHNRALSLMRGGKARAAIQEYRNAVAEMPSAHTLHFNLALVYQQTNQLKDAQREYRETERWLRESTGVRDADWARLYNAEGTLEAQRGRKKKARVLYEMALGKVPGMPEAVHNKALISDPVEKERLLSGNKSYLNSRIELAQIFKRKGRIPAAIAEYEAIVRERPDFAGAHLDLALLYLRSGETVPERIRLAADQLRLGAVAQPEFWKVSLVRAEMARVKGQDTEAKEYYRKARQRAPDRAARSEISESEKGKWKR